MIKILTVIGARPQIIKAAAISRAIKNYFSAQLSEILVHTGQHYDTNMSEVFFQELGIPAPNYNLNVGSGSHARQSAAMLIGLEEIIEKEKPDCVLLYGDTNSTLAGAMVASKMQVPIVHVEAGLRSFNKNMPEEINRIMCDHVSTLLFSPSKAGILNLKNEGISNNTNKKASIDFPQVFFCGDVMYDNSLHFSLAENNQSDILKRLHLQPEGFVLCTIHRDHNTDDLTRLAAIFSALAHIASSSGLKMLVPLHPRTKKNIEQLEIDESKIKIIAPVSFLEMISLEKNAAIILTDSGGVQKEAYFFQKPCVVLRNETEWTELLEAGTTLLAGSNTESIISAFSLLMQKRSDLQFPPLYGEGNAASFICEHLIKSFSPKC